MNKLLHLVTVVLVALALAGCGKQAADSRTRSKAATQRAPATPQRRRRGTGRGATGRLQATVEAARNGARGRQSARPTTRRRHAGAAAASGVQPSLRLGGPPTTAGHLRAFKEGANYRKVVPAQPTTVAPGKVEVVEVFWYGCGHCFTLDPALESWRNKGKAPYVEFVRVPGDVERNARACMRASVLHRRSCSASSTRCTR